VRASKTVFVELHIYKTVVLDVVIAFIDSSFSGIKLLHILGIQNGCCIRRKQRGSGMQKEEKTKTVMNQEYSNTSLRFHFECILLRINFSAFIHIFPWKVFYPT
jgi:hypothetical protein